MKSDRLGALKILPSSLRRRLIPAVCAGALAHPIAGHAQAVDYGTLEPLFGESITTSATGKPQRASEVPADMVIIDQDDIRRSGADNIPDILQFVTGINVRKYSFGDTQVGVNGYNSPLNPRLLVLVDGRQVYIDTLGFEAWNTLPVQLDEIRQIEIVRGPNSALFGFNAVSGVVNIVTFDPLLDNVNVATARGGNLGYGAGDAVATAHLGKSVGVRLSLGGWVANGYHDPTAAYAPSPRDGNVNIDAHWQVTGNILLRASGGVTDANTDRQENGQPQADYQNHLNFWRFGGGAQTRVGLLDLDAYENWGIDNARTGPVGTQLTLNTAVYRATDLFKLGSANTVRIGLEYRRTSVNSPFAVRGTLSYQNFAASGMWDWQISPMFDLTSAVRLDHLLLHYDGTPVMIPDNSLQDYNKATTTVASFNSGLVVQLTQADTLRLTLARGLQLPSTFDYGFNIPAAINVASPVRIAIVGSPFLVPSAVWHAQLGYTRTLNALDGQFETELFFERNTDMLAAAGQTNFVPVNGLLLSRSQNIGSSNEIGFEAGLNGKIRGGFRWNASYSYASISDDISAIEPPNQITHYARGTPAHTVILGLGYRGRIWEADMFGRWQSSYIDYIFPNPSPVLVGNYVAINARLGYQVTDTLTIAGTVEQLNRARLVETVADMVDRRFFATATLPY